MKIIIIKETKNMKLNPTSSVVKATRLKEMKEAIKLASKNVFLTF